MSEAQTLRAPRPKGDLHTETQLLSMGPSHPATHGTVKIMLEIDGEEIVEMDVQVGYLHRGFEKECESGTWYQAIPYTDRLNYNSAILANLAFCMAVEKLLGCEIPRRGQWVQDGAKRLDETAEELAGRLMGTPVDTGLSTDQEEELGRIAGSLANRPN